MSKERFLIVALILLSFVARAQWFPPVNFPPNYNICDNAPLKLVFYDDFNGTTLSNQWTDYVATPGGVDSVLLQDSEQPNSRKNDNIDMFYSPNNVEVSNGTVKLKLKNETWSWKCPTCPGLPETRNLTGAIIATRYRAPGNIKNGYNDGQFEAKIKFPRTKYSWSAFWIWFGSYADEIDFAEAYGGGLDWPYLGEKGIRNTYNTHAWPVALGNSENLPSYPPEKTGDFRFPHQSWFELFANLSSLHKQDDWHTYRVLWDSTKIDWYLDNNFVATIHKYYQDRQFVTYPIPGLTFIKKVSKFKVYPGSCYIGGVWSVTKGYPWYTKADANLRIETKIDLDQRGNPNAGVFEKFRTEVDYVKIWQRHPEVNNHTEICNNPAPVISGPNTICSTASYSVPGNFTGGTWSIDNNGLIINSNPNLTTVTVSLNPNSYYPNTTLKYTYTPEGCPTVYVYKNAGNTGFTNPIVTTTRNFYTGTQSFNLNVTYAGQGSTYEWDVDYGNSFTNTSHYHAFGQTITTPHVFTGGNTSYYLKWKVKITTACGTQTLNGQKSSLGGIFFKLDNPSTEIFDTHKANCFNADISHGTDSLEYEKSVDNALYSIFFHPEVQFEELVQKLDEIRMDKLAPYIVYDGSDLPYFYTAISTEQAKSMIETKIRVYPNPTSNILNIILLNTFNTEGPVVLTVYDLIGKKIKSIETTGVNLLIDVSTLAGGNYILQVSQGNLLEKYLFSKI